jgi:hypothetical protein
VLKSLLLQDFHFDKSHDGHFQEPASLCDSGHRDDKSVSVII